MLKRVWLHLPNISIFSVRVVNGVLVSTPVKLISNARSCVDGARSGPSVHIAETCNGFLFLVD